MATKPTQTVAGAQYNGTEFERTRGNIAEVVAASAAQSGTTNHTLTNHNASALLIIVDATASSGDATEDLLVNIEMQDPASGKWITVITDTAFTNGATGTVVYGIGTGIADTQTVIQAVEEVPAPRDLRVQTVVQQGGGSPDYTYSIGVHLIV